MSVVELIGVVRSRWRTVVVVALLCLATAAGLSALQTPLYESRSQIFVSSATDDAVEVYQGSMYSVQRVQSYSELARSAEVARGVIDDLGLSASPGELQAAVSAEVVPDTTVLQVTVSDPSAERAQAIARSYADVLTSTIAELETPQGQTQSLVKVTLIDDADLPGSPYSPNLPGRLLIALFIGLVVGFCTAVVRHLLDNKLRDPQESAEILGAPLLSVVGRVAQENAYESTDLAEAFRLLRTNLVFAGAGHRSGAYVVSSPSPGDGKTTVALELVRSLALSGRRVLLIDADLRKPSIAQRLGLDGEVGLTSVMIGAVDPHDAVQNLAEWGVDVMTSGRIPPNPSELIEAAVAPVLDWARGRYDMIVVDAAPLLPVSDTTVLSTYADGVVVVARYGVTTRRMLSLVAGRLAAVGGRPLGLVLNSAPDGPKSDYGYGYGYGYQGPAALQPLGGPALQQHERGIEPAAFEPPPDHGHEHAAVPGRHMTAEPARNGRPAPSVSRGGLAG